MTARLDPHHKALISRLVDAGYRSGPGWNAQHGTTVTVYVPSQKLTFSMRLEHGKWRWGLTEIVAAADDFEAAVAWVRATLGPP